MNQLFFVMAIMGCGDGSTTCAEARVEPVRYQTIQACQAALPDALARNTDLSSPVITGACRQQGTVMADASARRPRG